ALLGWTIETALQVERPVGVYVSTDDEEIATCARAFGADVIMRPAALATETSPVELTVAHACERFDTWHPNWSGAIMLNPTSPLRTSKTISYACTWLESHQRIVGVTLDAGVHFRG